MRKLIFIFCAVILLTSIVGCTINKPEISEESLIGSAQIMEGFEEIEDSEVILEEGKITFYLVPTEGQEVSKERLRELGLDFLKILSGYTANDELSGPTHESYGEIYDFYNVEIIVEGDREILDRGTKAKGDNEILWDGQDV